MEETRSIDGAAYERPAVEILEFAVECGFQGGTLTSETETGSLNNGGDW